MHEIEVKIRIEDPEPIRRRIAQLGGTPKTERLFEDNRLYDDADLSLKNSERIVRIRTVGDRSLLTFKAKLAEQSDEKYKVRIEHETSVGDPDQLDLVFRGLDLEPVYRYQKYRQKFVMPDAEILVDETPIGNFIEIEASPSRIDEIAAELGFSPDDFLTSTYHELHVDHVGADPPGDMVFEDDEESPPTS